MEDINISCIKLIAENDSAEQKMILSYKSKLKNENGFEGCINFRLKKGCNFGGFYLCTYSPEGECERCEQKSHPERFDGCLFCRSPSYNYTNSFVHCLECGDGFQKFMVKTFEKFMESRDINQGAYRLYSIGNRISERSDIRIINRKRLLPDFSIYFGKWKGFVTKYENGIYTHTIPEFTKEQIQKIVEEDSRVPTWKNIDEILLSHLIKLNINLYEPIQIK